MFEMSKCEQVLFLGIPGSHICYGLPSCSSVASSSRLPHQELFANAITPYRDTTPY